MKKLFILTPLLFLFILTSCDTSDIQNEIHEYVLKYDNEEHYLECECGDTIEVQAHTFAEPIIRLEPTCTNKGIKEYKCTGCDFIKLEDINELGHIEVIDKAIQVGCENEGLTEGSHCERCNQVLIKQETINPTGHSYSEFTTVTAPTCEGEGLEKKVCSHCNNEVFNTLPATGHEYSEFQTSTEPTCEGEGLEKKTCEHCAAEIFNTLPATGHTYSEFQVSKEPKCEETGLKYRTCSCGHIDYQEIEPKGHTPKNGTALNSTCTEYGHTAPVLCKDCGVTLTKEQLLPLLEHNYDEGVVVQESRITSYGIMEYTCKDCGNIKRVKTPKLVVDEELLANSLSFDNNIVIDAKAQRNDYEIKYIINDIIEYLYYIDRTGSNDIIKEYYKYEYNRTSMLYIHDLVSNTWSHEKFIDQTIFNEFKEFVNSKLSLTIDNFSKVKFANDNTSLTNTLVIDDVSRKLILALNSDGSLKSTQIYSLFEIKASYDDVSIEIPNMGNIHSIPEDDKCTECGMHAITITNSQGTYEEKYYIYDDLSFAYSATETSSGKLPSYFKQEIIKYENDNNNLITYKIKRYLSNNVAIYSFLVDSYTYNHETGALTLFYISGTETEIIDTHLKLDGSMEFEIMGSSPYEEYPKSHIGQTFEYRKNRTAYQFRFTENTMIVETYKTLDLVYIPSTNTLFDDIQFGYPNDLFYYQGSIGYLNQETMEFSSCSLYIDGLSFKVINEENSINIEAKIYDVKSLNHIEKYYYLKSEDGYKYTIYFYNGYIKQIKTYEPSTT